MAGADPARGRALARQRRARGRGNWGVVPPRNRSFFGPAGARISHISDRRISGGPPAILLAGASTALKPQAEAPHSAPVAPRGALHRRLRRRTCTARARTQRHRLFAARTSWPDLGVRARGERAARSRRSMANGEMLGSRSVLRRAWSIGLEPAAAGRRRARARVQAEAKWYHGSTDGGRIKGVRASKQYYPEEAAALAFFRNPRIT